MKTDLAVLKRRAFCLLPVLSSLLPKRVTAQEYTDPSTRPKMVNLHQRSLLKPQYDSDDFVVANFEKPLALATESEKLDDDNYIRTVANIANTAVNKISEEFPDTQGSNLSTIHIETQINIIHKIMQSIFHKIEKRFPEQNPYEVFVAKNIVPNYLLMNKLYLSANSYESLESLSRTIELDPKKTNLFHTDLSNPVRAELFHSSFSAVRSFLEQLFPKQTLAQDLVYQDVKDPSYLGLGCCFNDKIFLCSQRIKESAAINNQSCYQEKYTTLVNELLHHMMCKKFNSSELEKIRRAADFAGENYGTEYTVKNNIEIEEAISDIVSVAFNPMSFIDMLRTPYPFSSALASSIVKGILPKTFDHMQYYDWGRFQPQIIKDDFIDEFKKQGIKEPDLTRDLYLPALKKLKAFALESMKRYDGLIEAQKTN